MCQCVNLGCGPDVRNPYLLVRFAKPLEASLQDVGVPNDRA